MKDINEFGAQLKDRDIAFVGNSEKLFNRKNPIDQHEIVIRINRAWAIPVHRQLFSGKRTDFLFVSTEKRFIENALNCAARGVVWMTTSKRDKLSDEVKQRLYFYPEIWFGELRVKLNHYPSTGCMGCDLILRYIGNGRLTLYGFDFFQSHNWWKKRNPILKFYDRLTRKIPHGAHSGEAERKYLYSTFPHERLTVVPPD